MIFALLLLSALLPAWGGSRAQEETSRYFPETGHTVSGDFYVKYNSVEQPAVLFGYPITEAFTNSDQVLIQYFQKARFEQDPRAGGEARLTPLGRLVYAQNPPRDPLPLPGNPQACRYFPETDRRVCYAFLDFFEENGGGAQFGYPVSDFEFTSEHFVQYFEYARFDFRQAYDGKQQVSLADLGRIYFDLFGEDPRLLQPVQQSFIAQQTVLEMRLHAFVTRVNPPSQAEQLLYVIAQDQNLQLLPNASIDLMIRYPDETEQRLIMQPTNQFGFAVITFPVISAQPGIAEIIVTAVYNGLKSETRASFRIW